jgi:hypothetical protein
MKANLIQTHFNTGEVSPFMKGRVDTTKYAAGAEEVENLIPRPQGPLSRRPGTRHIDRTRDSTHKTRVIRFEFSVDQIYSLEFCGDGYIRFYRGDNWPLLTPLKTVTGAADAGDGFVLLTIAGHGWATGDRVWVEGVLGTTEANGHWRIEVVDANHIELVGVPFVHGYVSGGTAGRDYYEIGPTQYTDDDLDEIAYAQSGDVLFLVHPLYQPVELSRTSATTWEIHPFDNRDGPYMDYDDRDLRLQISNLSDTAEATSNNNVWAAGDVGKFFEYYTDGVFRLAKITAFTNAKKVTVNIVDIGQMKLPLHPQVKLQPKAKDVSRLPDGYGIGDILGAIRDARLAKDYFDRISPGGSVQDKTKLADPDGLDPQVVGALAGADWTADHQGVFGEGDKNKYFRLGLDTWMKISVIISSAKVTLAALPAAIVPINYPTNIVSITPNSRVYTARVTCLNPGALTIFTASDTDRHLRMNFQGRQVWMRITNNVSASVTDVQLYGDFPRHMQDASRIRNDGIADLWRFGSWSDTTGWPRAVTFHEGRLWFGGTASEPQTFWASRPNDFNKFSPTEPNSSVYDDNGLSFAILSTEVQTLAWMATGQVMLIGTLGGVWQVRASSSINDAITPTNISVKQQTNLGSRLGAMPVIAGVAVLYLSRSGRKLRELTYSFELDKWISRDVSIISEHMLRRGGTHGVELAYQQEPHGVIWVRLEDGTLAGMTYDKDQEVVSWHHHTLGQPINADNVPAVIESICCMTNALTGEDTLFMVVKRTFSGSIVRRQLEAMESEFYPTSDVDKDEAMYLDNAQSKHGTASSAITGAFNVEPGDEVHVIADGVYLGIFEVEVDSSILLTDPASTVHWGHFAEAWIKTLPPEGGSPFGSSAGRVKRIDGLVVRTWRTHSFSHGMLHDATLVETVLNNESLYSGDTRVSFEGTHDMQSGYFIVNAKPYPFYLLALMPTVHTQE